ncbi:MAG: ArsC family reductase [Rhodoferax sp.]|nr:ArsC family reductase [Rhodoferax sp.]
MNTTPPLTLHGIPNCDTVKKARAWLDGQGIPYGFVDFRKQGLSPQQLDDWVGQLGWQALLNTRGLTWRRLQPAQRAAAAAAAASACRLMLEQPTLVRRPVVQWPDGRASTGFDADDWEQRLQGRLQEPGAA